MTGSGKHTEIADDWSPIAVLPNLPLSKQIGSSVAALAPFEDKRIRSLCDSRPRLRSFLGRFSDSFGERFEPTVLLIRSDASPELRTAEAVASFRNLIALSAITYSRSLELRHPSGHRVLFGEAFAIYPWMLSKDWKELIGNTPALTAIHQVGKFRGQSSPSISRVTLDIGSIDQPLASSLMKRWRRRYESKAPTWADVSLFRSLNMAYHASFLPGGTEATFYDVGRLISLWVSTFEILVHPGGNGFANRDKVFALLEKTSWKLVESRNASYDTGGKNVVKRTLASWLYQSLHDCRNNFLHGNPVKREDLFLPICDRTIFQYAPSLYRIALTSFLPLTAPRLDKGRADSKLLGRRIARRIAFESPQKRTEEALLTAVKPPAGRRRAVR